MSLFLVIGTFNIFLCFLFLEIPYLGHFNTQWCWVEESLMRANTFYFKTQIACLNMTCQAINSEVLKACHLIGLWNFSSLDFLLLMLEFYFSPLTHLVEKWPLTLETDDTAVTFLIFLTPEPENSYIEST